TCKKKKLGRHGRTFVAVPAGSRQGISCGSPAGLKNTRRSILSDLDPICHHHATNSRAGIQPARSSRSCHLGSLAAAVRIKRWHSYRRWRAEEFSMAHMVKCVKMGREMEGLDEPPFDGEFGQRIYNNVSKLAWEQWQEHMKMLLNEYRLQPWKKEHQEFIVQQMDAYFFGEGAEKPKEFVPPKQYPVVRCRGEVQGAAADSQP